MREVFVAGVGMTPFGRHVDTGHAELTRASVREALADAGASVNDVDRAFYATVAQGLMADQHVVPGQFALRSLGLGGIPVVNVENACASSSTALAMACDYVGAGLAEVVLVVGTEKLYTDDRDRRYAVFNQPLDIEQAAAFLSRFADRLVAVPDGAATPAASVLMDSYAAQARLYMNRHPLTRRQLAAVAAKNHQHSVANPLAQYQKPFTVDEVLAGSPVSWPLTAPMCAPISDGSAAALVCSADALTRLPDARPIRVLASVLRSGSDRDPDDLEAQVTHLAATEAYERAGVGPGDVSVAEVHDASAIGEVYEVEALGLCPPGETGDRAERGETSLGGRIPVNPSGGLVSKGHPLAATGLGQVFELVGQLRGDAGARQVEGARIAVAENGGGFIGVESAAAVVTILASTSW